MKRRVGQYLIDYLQVNGVDKIFGVPGDFNLAFLDDVEGHKKVEWVGNTNELNASYAADGYARLNGLGAMITTFGVGELSAVNGIAGSYAERVPVVEITGAPTQLAEKAKRYLHHSLGEGSFDDYIKMYDHITAASAYITAENAQTEIPRVINAAIAERRPVHIHLPIDVAMTEIDIVEEPKAYVHQAKSVTKYIDAVKEGLAKATKPLILVGHEINSFNLHDKIEKLANQTKIPVAQLSFGKSAMAEDNPYYIGIYDGALADDSVKAYAHNSDFIINLGAKLTDSATAGFSYPFNLDDLIFMNQNEFKYGDLTSDNISLIDMVDGLLAMDYVNKADLPVLNNPETNELTLNDDVLSQEDYFKLMQSFIKEGDVLLAEQGTSFFGAYTLKLPKKASFIGQPLWGSIGYTLPSLLGTQLVDKERRNILLIGDGSLQLTAQEISTMIRQKIKPIIFVVNNDGYTVERLIHGMYQPYNSVQMWNYKMLPQAFGDNEQHVRTYDVKSSKQLAEVMKDISGDRDHMHLVEVHMAVEDSPAKLTAIAKSFADANK